MAEEASHWRGRRRGRRTSSVIALASFCPGAELARSMPGELSQWDGICVLILVLFCDVTHMRKQDNWETLGRMQRGWRAT
jgi:hypothetical protein